MAKQQALKSQEQDQLLYSLLNSSDIQLVPYVELEDGWSLDYEVLLQFGIMAQTSPIFSRTFYDGTVNDPQQFVEKMQSRRNNPVFIFDHEKPAAVAWLNDVTANYAFGHFMVLPDYWGERAMEFGHRVLDYWFTISPALEFVIGMIPGFNRLAMAYIKRLGFKDLGRVPMLMVRNGRRDDCAFFYYSRFDHD